MAACMLQGLQGYIGSQATRYGRTARPGYRRSGGGKDAVGQGDRLPVPAARGLVSTHVYRCLLSC